MMLGTIVGWIVAGLIVGALSRLVMPGKQNMGIALTIGLVIVGALVGGFIASFLFGPNLVADSTGTYAVETAWPGWIMAIIGGALVLWLYLAATGSPTSNRRLP